MKKLAFLFVAIIFNFSNVYAVTYNSDPKIFVQELVGDAIKILGDKSVSIEDKRKGIEKIALNNVDIKGLGMYTLGNLRKDLNDENKKKYNLLFEKYFLKSLTSRLEDYTSDKFEVIDSEQKSSNYTIVSSRIIETPKKPEIKIDWRIYTKDPIKPLIRDLIVEGLSLARTQKEEFASILNSNNNDINVLFEKMQEFINK